MNIDKAARLAVENCLKEGLTDIFPRLFEVDLLKDNSFARDIQNTIQSRLKSGTFSGLKIHPLQYVLYPKKDLFDFRRAALMQPMDTVVYLALVLTIADEIEKCRPKIRENKVFSYRFKPKNGLLFNPEYNFTAFNNYVSAQVRKKRIKVLVKCDIANFYDRLNIHRLESTLISLSLDKSKVQMINQLLLFWANRDSYSLPIGSNASRILAEASLISVDEYLISHKVHFCRFVDDYRFFAPDIESAHAWLTLFVERLFLEGLSINPMKTSFEDVKYRTDSVVTPPSNQVSKKNTISPVRLIIGYTGTIPTKFRELSEKEISDLKKQDLNVILNKIKKQVVLIPDDVKLFLRILVAQNAYSNLDVASDILKRFPQFTPLIIDLLIRKADQIPEKNREELKSFFVEKVKLSERTPEYILISIVRLLGSNQYACKDVLLELFRNLKRNSGAFIGRSIINAIQDLADENDTFKVSRNDVLEIRQYFNRADAWERRAIIRLVNKVLPEEEKRPWLKNVKIHNSEDLFTIKSCDSIKEK